MILFLTDTPSEVVNGYTVLVVTGIRYRKMNLHHINIKAPLALMEAEKQFFCEVLGLHEGHRPDFISQGYWLYCADQAIVHLSLSEQHFSNERQGYFDHVAFQTTDLLDLLQRLDNAGIEYSSNHVSQIGMTQVFLKSPSATGIEVNCLDEAT